MIKKLIIFTLIIIITFILIISNDWVQVNIMTRLVILRGVIAPNCFWYKISDLFFKDGSGIKIYNKLKNKSDDFTYVNLFSTNFYLVTNNNYIKIILDNSPDIFNVGSLKQKFFKSFMSKNVGVSTGCPWKYRREINDNALDSEKIHRYSSYYNFFLKENVKFKNSVKYDDFSDLAKMVMKKIVFNDKNVNNDVVLLFSKANNIKAFYNKLILDKRILKNYKDTLNHYIDNPKKYSLVELCLQVSNNKEEIYHQIPHFIFPILGIFTLTIPRLLCLLCNHRNIFEKIIEEINNEDLYNLKYLRKCILETVRLNNPVISMFRTLEKDFNFDNKHFFKKGTEFLILTNPVLREKEYFDKPNEFLPERWNKSMEDSYYFISFSQGPQKCPGKELVIFLVQSFIFNFIKLNRINKYNLLCNKELNIKNIPQVINPCTLEFDIVN